ncbi:Uu.00g020590.m01.CDS01 [Anthostomella pinea]|uniref:Uu.00g020590.m01.CDS01 n=1 Tax=Anthostomella pinea TaxID=933095 RepID=A0AAI8YQU8_9PEZI|nr:Uu.00g020590.m01.CDS01 [Anthostomella pinea]
MDPSGPAQPPLNAAYKTEGNPVTSNPAEKSAAQHHHQGKPVDERLPSQPSDIKDATPSSLGRGVRGAPAGEEKFGRSHEDVGRHNELEGEQMRASGEGDVANVVDRKPGATGSQPDLASDLDRKKHEQASAREAIKEDRKHGNPIQFLRYRIPLQSTPPSHHEPSPVLPESLIKSDIRPEDLIKDDANPEPSSIKRKRGRPKGSKNKKRPEETVEVKPSTFPKPTAGYSTDHHTFDSFLVATAGNAPDDGAGLVWNDDDESKLTIKT